MAVISDKMGQSWLLPPAVSDLIPVDHICYLVIAIVNGIDVSDVEQKYMSGPGNPAYLRRMLYASSYPVRPLMLYGLRER